MKSIVCIKQVPLIYIQSGFSQETQAMVEDGLIHILNPYDEIAVEEALRQKEREGKGEITVLTVGPDRSAAALRWCLAMGANNAIHVRQGLEENLDSWSTASILADIIRNTAYDLLLFGKKAIDDEMGLVGTFVAELLDLPVVTAVTRIEKRGEGSISVLRALERGNREAVTCPLPAVLTVDQKLNRPRYPTLPDRKAARTFPIHDIELGSATIFPVPAKIETVRLSPPKLRPKKMLAPDSSMSPAEQLRFVMTGGLGNKKGGSVGGDPKKAASGIIDFLKEKKIIDG